MLKISCTLFVQWFLDVTVDSLQCWLSFLLQVFEKTYGASERVESIGRGSGFGTGLPHPPGTGTTAQFVPNGVA